MKTFFLGLILLGTLAFQIQILYIMVVGEGVIAEGILLILSIIVLQIEVVTLFSELVVDRKREVS